MGLRVVFPRAFHHRLPDDHEVYPYLLRGASINRPNQVWSIDLTYIRLAEGFVYLTAIIDWYSRMISNRTVYRERLIICRRARRTASILRFESTYVSFPTARIGSTE